MFFHLFQSIYTTINFTRYSVTKVGALYGRLICGWLGVVVARNFPYWASLPGRAGHGCHTLRSSSQQQTLSGRGARVYTCTRVHDNAPCRRLPK